MMNLPSIRLRAVEPDDAEFMFVSENDEQCIDSSDNIAPLSMRQLTEYALTYDADPFRAGQLRMIVENETGLRVGIADLYEISSLHSRACAAIYIVEPHRRKGYALAALEALATYARSRLGLSKIAARILSNNHASMNLFRKAGYKPCAILPQWHFASGRFHDMHIFIISLKQKVRLPESKQPI